MAIGSKLAGLLLVAVLAACGSPASPPASSAPADPVDRGDIVRLTDLAAAALLRDGELPFAVDKHVNRIDRIGYRLQHACNAELPTDARIVTTDSDWAIASGSRASLDQMVVAYDRPVAGQAVKEAAAALSCGRYKLLDYAYADRTPLDLDGDGVGFCERVTGGGDDAYLCTVIAGHDQIACSVRAWAHDHATAEAYARQVWPAVVKRCG